MANRDFKGVWIPKDIWLTEDLTALEKFIFTEIDSLDNDEHCTASNEYLAKFCGCSVKQVSNTISKLIELGFIEIASFDGRQRVMKVCNQIVTLHSKNCHSATQNLLPINIDNNISISKDIDIKKKEKKKENKFSKCSDIVETIITDEDVKEAIYKYLKVRIKVGLTVEQWSDIVDSLYKLADSKEDALQIIDNAYLGGYRKFYPITKYKSSKFVDDISDEKNDEDLLREKYRKEFACCRAADKPTFDEWRKQNE